jgi:putative ABC transport system ATP-binding protein
MKTILEVKNLTKTYGRGDSLVKAVDDVSLTVNEGEFVAIIGASGSGKSTLLHLIGGVDRPDEKKKSEIIIDGTDITKLNDNKLALFRRDHIGIIYQFYNLIPVLTVKENITLPADLAKREIDEKYLKDLIKNLGLTERENHLPNQLSGGQQQRTAIGRALYGRPDLILADEPTGNLDSKAGEEIVKLLKLANEKYHQTVILVTHDLNIAKQASRVITVADGKIVSDKGTRHARSK